MRKLIKILILICVTCASLWALPALVRKATYTPDSYPFVYFGSVLREFALIDYQNKAMPMADLSGNRYTASQFDSLMPLLNFRQLISDDRLPDSIGGYEVSPQLLRMTSVVFRYHPKEVASPDPRLYVLFEAMPKRGGLEIPPDLMRLDRDVEFIDARSNTVDREKSDRFRAAFDKAGFAFPAQWAAGNPNPRKPYDEGYFSLDANGNLFHIKLVNNRPYVRDTRIGETIDVRSFSMYESADKRFYGFVFDRQGGVHIVESDLEGGYETVRLDIDPIDPAVDQLTVMGNLLYWTVTVATPRGRDYYALETLTLDRVSQYAIGRQPNRWDRVSRWLFPAYLTFEHDDTAYVFPRLTFTACTALIVNLLAAVVMFFTMSGTRRKKTALACYVALTGLAGALAVVILPGFGIKSLKQ